MDRIIANPATVAPHPAEAKEDKRVQIVAVGEVGAATGPPDSTSGWRVENKQTHGDQSSKRAARSRAPAAERSLGDHEQRKPERKRAAIDQAHRVRQCGS